MSEKLKPVPCGCGGEAKVVKHEYFECSPTYGVTCQKCGTATYQGFDTEAEAVEVWNRAMGALLPEGDPQKNVGCKCSNTTERTAKVDADWGLAICCACKKRVFPSEKYCSYCGARLEWE